MELSLADELRAAADELRRGHGAAGAEAFGAAVERLARLLELPANADAAAALLPALQEALAAQERGDWIGLADLVQYELAARLA